MQISFPSQGGQSLYARQSGVAVIIPKCSQQVQSRPEPTESQEPADHFTVRPISVPTASLCRLRCYGTSASACGNTRRLQTARAWRLTKKRKRGLSFSGWPVSRSPQGLFDPARRREIGSSLHLALSR